VLSGILMTLGRSYARSATSFGSRTSTKTTFLPAKANASVTETCSVGLTKGWLNIFLGAQLVAMIRSSAKTESFLRFSFIYLGFKVDFECCM